VCPEDTSPRPGAGESGGSLEGSDPMTGRGDPVAPPKAGGEVTRQPSGGGGTGLKIGGWILAVLGGLLLLSGIALVVIHLTQRDKDGYYTSSTKEVAAPGYAITAEGLDISDLPSSANDVLGRVRVSATSSNGQPLFVGIATQTAVNGYLAGVARSEVTDVNPVKYTAHAGRAPAGPPARQSFWRSSASGRGQVTTSWKVKGGNWSIVVMNADGTAHVGAAVKVGAKTNLVLWIGLGLILAGLIAGGAGVAMLAASRSG
jgi:hypothetical protein